MQKWSIEAWDWFRQIIMATAKDTSILVSRRGLNEVVLCRPSEAGHCWGEALQTEKRRQLLEMQTSEENKQLALEEQSV